MIARRTEACSERAMLEQRRCSVRRILGHGSGCGLEACFRALFHPRRAARRCFDSQSRGACSSAGEDPSQAPFQEVSLRDRCKPVALARLFSHSSVALQSNAGFWGSGFQGAVLLGIRCFGLSGLR